MKILDAHTHLAGSESGESAPAILQALDACGVDKAFIFAPLLDVKTSQLSVEHLTDIRTHNDYCSNICSEAPDRLFGFCVLNPSPALAGGSKSGAVQLMVDEVRRCHGQLGLRGVKMVPNGWYPDDQELLPLYKAIAELGMYVVFHVGIFLDGRQGRYCRPAYYERIHDVSGLHVQLAHMGWPWEDECLAVLDMEVQIAGADPAQWQCRADMSFGPPADWQLDTWQKTIDTLPPQMFGYGSDMFWPCSPERYENEVLRPQLGLFETAATRGHIAGEGSPGRAELRQRIFHDNIWEHWQAAIRSPQRPRAVKTKIVTPRAHPGRTEH